MIMDMDRDYLMGVLTMLGLTIREAEVSLTIVGKRDASVKDIYWRPWIFINPSYIIFSPAF